MAVADEAAFMSQLLQGLDESFWSAVPSPDPSPIKQKKPIPPAIPCTPTKSRQTKQILSSTVFSANNHDITAFLEGSEDWDLDADPFSPIKPAKTVVTEVSCFPCYFLDAFDLDFYIEFRCQPSYICTRTMYALCGRICSRRII
jgi:hypothetical protein